MKKFYLLVALSFAFNGFAQFNSSAPWLKNGDGTERAKENNQDLTYDQLVLTSEKYWESKDKFKKGSGYKPFKRWEYHWRNQVNDKGFIMSPAEMKMAMEQKRNAKSQNSRNANRSALALPTSNWLPLGPFGNATQVTSAKTRARGRINVIVADPSNANVMYFGTPGGGAWKTNNINAVGGPSWTPLCDNEGQMGVSGIAIDYSNSNTVYIATGDSNAGDTYSIGVLKSTNGGTTWAATGLTFGNTSSRAGDLLIHPTNNQILWCATSAGLQRTINGGTTWSIIQAGDFSQGAMKLKPGTGTATTPIATIYACTDTSFYKSSDNGATFTVTTTGLPNATTTLSARMKLDVSPAAPDNVYVISAKSATGLPFQGVYRSTNSGASFVKRSAIGTPTNIFENDQAWYALAYAVSNTNADTMFSGALNVWKSTDGGVANANWGALNSWSTYNASFTHADIHYLQYINGQLFCGSDGGIYRSLDNGATFTDLTGTAQISQFYKIAVAKQTSEKVAGGLQDNGGYGFSNGTWKGYHGGDGMDCAISPANSNIYYGFSQYGQGLTTSDNSGEFATASTTAPTAETGTGDTGGNWVTPMAANSAGELFAGYNKLYKLDATGAWALQMAAGPLNTIGAGDVEEIEISPTDDNIIFVANGVDLYRSINKGVNFTKVYTAVSGITSIEVNSSDNTIVYITTAGTTGDVMKSTNGAAATLTFTSIKTGLPNIGKNVIRHQGRNTLNPLYVGTSLGVFYRDDSMTQFEPFDTNLPNVDVNDLEINVYDGFITAGTYGRGVWRSEIPYQAPANELRLVSVQNVPLTLTCSAPTISAEINVKNIGANPVTTVSVNYDYNGTPLAYNWTGTIAVNATQTIPLPSFTPATRGAYTLNVTSTIVGDTYLDNNQGSAPFYVNDSGTVGVTNTFEATNSGLLTSNEGSASSLWTRTTNTTALLGTGTNTVYTTNATGQYPNATKSYIYSQCYDLRYAVNPQIKFKMAYDLEPDWDIVYVEYSTNLGANWTVLGAQGPNWYNSNRTPTTATDAGAAADCLNCPGKQWTTATTAPGTTLTPYFYGLNSLIGQQNVIFRIVFHADEAVQAVGVVIDDFVVDGVLSNKDFDLQNIAIYPNPSTGVFNVSTGDKAIDKLEVYDVTGKVIVSIKDFSSVNSEKALDLNNVSTGIYFIKVSSNNLSTVKRIIKN
ncbi:T9SS type A sorting domain-containing protein [Flavobacterium sp.]|uniref:T9SS type A sorting domain-containing protein n=1 Tax=Flavobacterium sp. TaxID=239 RepID=UPI00286E111D|nr:T9SS type A sorting domain-containing protein [Flavobacterium sp.]